MTLLSLDVRNLRNIRTATLQPAPTMNFIVGANASGKSSLLEALFVLSRGYSFRTPHIKHAIAFEQSHLLIAAQHQYQNLQRPIGIQHDGKAALIRINQEKARKEELAYLFPLQLIHPKSYQLLDAGPQLRREFIDWGVFNLDNDFLPYWRAYRKALHHRNVLLKTRQSRQLTVWDKALAQHGEPMNQLRCQYIQQLQPKFAELAAQLLGDQNVDMRFMAGFDDSQPLLQQLQQQHEKDLRYGFTGLGPHRADFVSYFHNKPAKDFLSRGQLKLMVLALMLAQVDLLNARQQGKCCILIDDLAAELDTENRLKLLKYLNALNCQVFITATEQAVFEDYSELTGYKMFHVEHGRFRQID
jgi:DNA replication and repair protein RecF